MDKSIDTENIQAMNDFDSDWVVSHMMHRKRE